MGYLRFFLALTVAAMHLWSRRISGEAAVCGFYCISGFFITKTIHEVYGNTFRGKFYFLINRVLRIYPTYYLCFAVSLIFLYSAPEAAHRYYPTLIIPHNWQEWWPQLTIFGLGGRNQQTLPKIIPAAWSLDTELMFYLVMCFLICKSVRRCIAWGILSVSVSIYLVWNHYPFAYHYFTYYGSSVYFAAGALLYHAQPRIPRHYLLNARLALHVGVAMGYVPFLIGFSPRMMNGGYDPSYPLYLYATLPVFIYVIACLDQGKPLGQWEQWMADISYPLYLMHMLAGAIVSCVLNVNSFAFTMIAMMLTIAFSISIAILIRFCSASLRRRIRNKAKAVRPEILA